MRKEADGGAGGAFERLLTYNFIEEIGFFSPFPLRFRFFIAVARPTVCCSSSDALRRERCVHLET